MTKSNDSIYRFERYSIPGTKIVLSMLLGYTAMPACAGFVSVGGAAVERDPPAVISLGSWASNTEIRAWFERETTLNANIQLEHVASGFINDEADLEQGSIPSGTDVRSFMVRLDTVGSTSVTLTGFAIFDQPILGVIISSDLELTDQILGRPETIYNNNTTRGLELRGLAGGDSFEISADRLRIDFRMAVRDGTDDIRIVTVVPAPSGALNLALVGLFTIRRRRR